MTIDNLGLGHAIGHELVSTTPKMAVEDQIIAWGEMHEYFIRDIPPSSSPGGDYLSAYIRSPLPTQATIREKGFHQDYLDFSDEVYNMLKGLI